MTPRVGEGGGAAPLAVELPHLCARASSGRTG